LRVADPTKSNLVRARQGEKDTENRVADPTKSNLVRAYPRGYDYQRNGYFTIWNCGRITEIRG